MSRQPTSRADDASINVMRYRSASVSWRNGDKYVGKFVYARECVCVCVYVGIGVFVCRDIIGVLMRVLVIQPKCV